MISNGNSFANGNSRALGDGEVSTGNERPGLGMGWMFPGASSGIQQMCNRM